MGGWFVEKGRCRAEGSPTAGLYMDIRREITIFCQGLVVGTRRWMLQHINPKSKVRRMGPEPLKVTYRVYRRYRRVPGLRTHTGGPWFQPQTKPYEGWRVWVWASGLRNYASPVWNHGEFLGGLEA